MQALRKGHVQPLLIGAVARDNHIGLGQRVGRRAGCRGQRATVTVFHRETRHLRLDRLRPALAAGQRDRGITRPAFAGLELHPDVLDRRGANADVSELVRPGETEDRLDHLIRPIKVGQRLDRQRRVDLALADHARDRAVRFQHVALGGGRTFVDDLLFRSLPGSGRR